MTDAATTPPPSWAVGIVNHGSYRDLAGCLDSVARQTCPPRRVYVWDTGVDPAALDELAKAHPGVSFEHGSNRGFAGGGNRAVATLRQDAEFVLILNPDVVLDADFAEKLLYSVEAEPDVAIAGGKLLRPGRELIDSAGIRFPRHRRPRDRGSESPDRGEFDRRERIEAVSGAAMLLREAAIDGLSIEGELFDEVFFAYHEDTDLCWRARRFGWTVLYEPAAVAVHGRGWRSGRRAEIPVAIRRHSFKNHYLQLVKNETLAGFLMNAPWLIGWEVLRLGFVLIRDRGMLGAYRETWRELPGAWRKRRLIGEIARNSGNASRR